MNLYKECVENSLLDDIVLKNLKVNDESELADILIKNYKNEERIMCKVLEFNPFLFSEIGEALKNRKSIAKIMIKNEMSLSWFNEEIRADRELVKIALSSWRSNIFWVSPDLKKDKNFIREVLETMSFDAGEEFLGLPREIEEDESLISILKRVRKESLEAV